MEILFENRPVVTKAIYSEFHKTVNASRPNEKFIIVLIGAIIIFGIGLMLLIASHEKLLWVVFCFVFAVACPCICVLLQKLSEIAYFKQYVAIYGGSSDCSVEITQDYISKKDKFSVSTYAFSEITLVCESNSLFIIVIGNGKPTYQKNILLEKNSFTRGSSNDFINFISERINNGK